MSRYHLRSNRPDPDGTTETWINFMGREFVVELEWSISSYGSAPSFYDPGDGPDFDIDRIWLRENREDESTCAADDFGPAFEVTGKLFQVICNQTRICDDVYNSILRTI